MQQQHLLNRMRPHGDDAAGRALELLDPQRLPTHRMRLALDPPFEESLVPQEGHSGVAEQVRSAHDLQIAVSELESAGVEEDPAAQRHRSEEAEREFADGRAHRI